MSTEEPSSSLVPRPRPGFESADDEPRGAIATYDRVRLVAGLLRGMVGLLFIFMALLFLPAQMWTPVLSGMGLVMVVNASLAVWKVAREEPRLAWVARPMVYVLPAGAVALFVAFAVLGAAAFGPDWGALRGRAEPPRFQPQGGAP